MNRFQAPQWRPLFIGAEAQAIQSLVEEIVAAVREPDPAWISSPGLRTASERAKRMDSASLFGGSAGLALLHGYCGLCGIGGADERRLAQVFLDRAMEVIASVPSPPGLATGFTGVAWAMQHLLRVLAITPEEDPVAAADEALELALSNPAGIRDYDLISGPVGWGVYCLERLPSPSAEANLVRIVNHLDTTAEHTNGRTTWYSPPEWFLPHQRQLAPTGYYNVGMAHGVAGVLAMLAAAWSAGFKHDRIPALIENTVRWVLEQERPAASPLRFANWIVRGQTPDHSRFAWCYGDPGVVIGLYGAVRCIEDADLCDEILDLARHVGELTRQHPDVMDSGLCHGAAGVGHIFNRFYQSTGDSTFAEIARHWFRTTLAMRKPGIGIAGLQSFKPYPDLTSSWVDDGSFLTGTTGTALALLAAVTSTEPLWDRILLTCLPVRGAA